LTGTFQQVVRQTLPDVAQAAERNEPVRVSDHGCQLGRDRSHHLNLSSRDASNRLQVEIGERGFGDGLRAHPRRFADDHRRSHDLVRAQERDGGLPPVGNGPEDADQPVFDQDHAWRVTLTEEKRAGRVNEPRRLRQHPAPVRLAHERHEVDVFVCGAGSHRHAAIIFLIESISRSD